MKALFIFYIMFLILVGISFRGSAQQSNLNKNCLIWTLILPMAVHFKWRMKSRKIRDIPVQQIMTHSPRRGPLGRSLGCGCDHRDVSYYRIHSADETGGCRWRNYRPGNASYNSMSYKMSVVHVYDVVFGREETIFSSYSCFMNYIHCTIRNSSEKPDEWTITLHQSWNLNYSLYVCCRLDFNSAFYTTPS